jgi:hypothetical protein
MGRTFIMLALVSCARDAPAPSEYEFHLRVSLPLVRDPSVSDAERSEQANALRDFDGSAVVLGDEAIGLLADEGNAMRLKFRRPATGAPDDVTQGLALDVPTVCGPHRIPLAATVQKMSKWYSVDGELVPPKFERGRAVIDWGGQAPTVPLKIGDFEVEHGKQRVTLLALGCELDVEITLGGEKIGVWTRKDPVVLVSVEPDVCYTFQWVGYGENIVSGNVGSLDNARVQAIPGEPAGFLEPAPSTIHGRSAARQQGELLRTECHREERDPEQIGDTTQ